MKETERIVLERIDAGKCPVCGKNIELDYQIITHPKYGKVRLCKSHYVDQHIIDESM